MSSKANDPRYILNPNTGRWVLRTGKVGKKVLADMETTTVSVSKSVSVSKKVTIPLKSKTATVSFDLHGSVYYKLNDVRSNKIAAFDMDGTIIQTKSGAKFAKGSDDWKFTYENVVSTIQSLHSSGYKSIIFSNQGGLTSGKTQLSDLQVKIQDITSQLNVPVEVYLMSAKDNFRKPMTDTWDFMLENNELDPETVDQVSFYCGDAAGRSKGYMSGKPKDFNITDRYFAQNSGVTFMTPEELFLNMDPFPYVDPYLSQLNLHDYAPSSEYPLHTQLNESDNNLIIMVGAPASGKSTISLIYPDYVYLNNDTIKSKSKFTKMFNQAIDDSKSIIVDNTNPKKDTRKVYIDAAKKQGYKVYCYYFDLPKLLVYHLNQMRVQISHGKSKAIPRIAYNIYYKNLVVPSKNEGFDQIVTVNSLHKSEFTTKHFDRYYWYSYDLK
jgi:bifunctional polynucleotide phosphatase/kinase